MPKPNKVKLAEEEKEEEDEETPAAALPEEDEEEETPAAEMPEDDEEEETPAAALPEEEEDDEEEEAPSAELPAEEEDEEKPKPKTEIGLLARIRSLFAKPDQSVDLLAAVEKLKSERDTLYKEKVAFVRSAKRERKGRAKAEAEVFLKDHGRRFNGAAAKIFRGWLVTACAESQVTISKDALVAFAESLPDLHAVLGTKAGKLPPADTSAAEAAANLGGDDDAVLDAKIRATMKSKGVSYAEAFDIVRKAEQKDAA